MKQVLKSFVRQAFGVSRGAAARRAPTMLAPLRTLDRQALRAVSGGADGSDSPKPNW